MEALLAHDIAQHTAGQHIALAANSGDDDIEGVER
jgi:hypothetical protein